MTILILRHGIDIDETVATPGVVGERLIAQLDYDYDYQYEYEYAYLSWVISFSPTRFGQDTEPRPRGGY
jgi:hypothetical protein